MPGPLALAAIGGAIGAVGSIGGAIIGARGQREANETNAHQAQLNREFQERMANTQYQRGVADMRAAGLNPALAYQQGGAASPSGTNASAALNPMGGIQHAVNGIASGAQDAMNTYLAIKKTASDIALTDAQTNQTRFNTALATEMRPGQLALQHIQEAMQRSTFATDLEQRRATLRATDASAEDARERIKRSQVERNAPTWLRHFMGPDNASDLLNLADHWRDRVLVPKTTNSARAVNEAMSKNRYTERPWWVRKGSYLDPEK